MLNVGKHTPVEILEKLPPISNQIQEKIDNFGDDVMSYFMFFDNHITCLTKYSLVNEFMS